MKPKRWHQWLLDITEIGENYSAKQLQEKLYNHCLEKEGRGTTYVPPTNSIASFLSRTDSFENVLYDKKNIFNLWRRIK